MIKGIFDNTLIPLLSKTLDGGVARQRSIAANIANVTTPGYRRVEVKFEEKLQHALHRWRVKGARTHSSHRSLGRHDLSDVRPEVIRPNDVSMPSGVNNVNIDHEMGELAKNQLTYRLNVRLLTKGFNALRTSIRGRPGG